MPQRADDPLRKVTLNLYEADCAILEHTYGHGWSTHIREIVHEDALATKAAYRGRKARTLGDLADDH